MGRPDQCADLLKEGLLPTEIASKLGISASSVVQYLYVAVGKGRIRPSDIVLTIPYEVREIVEAYIDALETDYWFALHQAMSKAGVHIPRDELQLLIAHRSALAGDMYLDVTRLELELHTILEKALKKVFGEDRDRWWDDGIPEWTRIRCKNRLEADEVPANHPYFYTNFCDMAKIIKQNWDTLESLLPQEETRRKGALVKDLDQAYKIRNRIMHPVRGFTPSREDFEFIVGLRERLTEAKWRNLGN